MNGNLFEMQQMVASYTQEKQQTARQTRLIRAAKGTRKGRR